MRLEFKEARTELPATLFETICAMLNRDGGDILLGVDDRGAVAGIAPGRVDVLKANLVNLSNNPQKLDPLFILFAATHDIDGKIILHVSVPASSQVHRSAGVVFDRANDGDFRVTQPHRIAEISNRKRRIYTEDKVYPYARMKDLRLDLLPECRNLMLTRDPDHPWLKLTDEQLLLKAGLYRHDEETGKEGYTLAAILLLGPEEMIQSALPYYKIDLLLRLEQVDRYDDREILYCNLIEAYPRVMAFIAKHLPDPFYLEGDRRISLRGQIFREVVANFLIHREYGSAHYARLTIYRERVETINASSASNAGPVDPSVVVPYPRNPALAKFFTQLVWAEELGSGMVKIGKYLPLYAKGSQPKYTDGAVFTTAIPLIGLAGWNVGQVAGQVAGQVSPEVHRLVGVVSLSMTRMEIQRALELKSRENFERRYLKPALADGVLEMTLPDKPNSRLQRYRLTEAGKKLLACVG